MAALSSSSTSHRLRERTNERTDETNERTTCSNDGRESRRLSHIPAGRAGSAGRRVMRARARAKRTCKMRFHIRHNVGKCHSYLHGVCKVRRTQFIECDTDQCSLAHSLRGESFWVWVNALISAASSLRDETTKKKKISKSKIEGKID